LAAEPDAWPPLRDKPAMLIYAGVSAKTDKAVEAFL
jgi:hypothetical protein